MKIEINSKNNEIKELKENLEKMKIEIDCKKQRNKRIKRKFSKE